MEHIHGVISSNLQLIRKKRKMSLEDLANCSGVSKSLLRQIEKEESNPTISTLWKIANGLKIPFTSLIQYEIPDTEIIRKSDITPLTEGDGLYRLYPNFSYEDQKPFEMYSVELESNAILAAEPHPPNSIECITVVNGSLTITIENHKYSIQEGDSIKFRGDLYHTYMNETNEITKLSMVIYYPKK
ncbi:XRE family transcriptional regulator [Cytobacillus spongiae]|uniref:helix-turn-helix domain-containing protein n=1 Tax=Cytobacillus spongiae TaxID=2901381 RepID=UPI001F451D75|nr:XRE family transcriptional regulator [Cytobacillus spongiae]UII57655.1 XRE family transcriptional regulator [Cytobacillus spongiae]